jgi:hypothetical protein
VALVSSPANGQRAAELPSRKGKLDLPACAGLVVYFWAATRDGDGSQILDPFRDEIAIFFLTET